MSMRRVLAWKPSGEHPQGEGYQYPEVTELKVASPTLSRLGKVLTLQWTAFNHAGLECADAKSAFERAPGCLVF